MYQLFPRLVFLKDTLPWAITSTERTALILESQQLSSHLLPYAQQAEAVFFSLKQQIGPTAFLQLSAEGEASGIDLSHQLSQIGFGSYLTPVETPKTEMPSPTALPMHP